MGQRDGLAGALSVEDITAVAAVVLAVHEAKRSAASHADVRVYPFRRLSR